MCFSLQNMVICAIVGCSKRSGRDKDVSFYRIPCVNMKRNLKNRDLILERQKTWIRAIKREDLDELKIKNARICSLHFISGKPSEMKDTENPDWVPSINLGYGSKQTSDNLQRYERRIKRQKADVSADNEPQDPTLADVSISDNADFPVLETTDKEVLEGNHAENLTAEGKMEAESNTELSMLDIEHLKNLEKDYVCLQSDYYSLKETFNCVTITVDTFVDCKKIKFYTGLPNAKLLKIVYEFVSPAVSFSSRKTLAKFQEMILVLMRLRLNLLTEDLGFRFSVSQGTVCRIFSQWIDIMYVRLQKLVYWPERANLLKTMPMSFRIGFDGHVAVIIDCFEISIDRPSSLITRAATWSNYKQKNTVKYLIGITPQGFISFISLGWGGRTSDKVITERSGILNNLIPGDAVLADRGFNNLNSVGFYCSRLVVPASARGKKQLSPTEVEKTREIACLRIEVEQVIGLLRKKFRILKGPLPLEFCVAAADDVTPIDKIVHVCCALVNLMTPIVSLQ